nr:MAG: hypothetical protein BECKFW1821B_GA0114236_12124 [Candidatus Kentron sp. FW]
MPKERTRTGEESKIASLPKPEIEEKATTTWWAKMMLILTALGGLAAVIGGRGMSLGALIARLWLRGKSNGIRRNTITGKTE